MKNQLVSINLRLANIEKAGAGMEPNIVDEDEDEDRQFFPAKDSEDIQRLENYLLSGDTYKKYVSFY